MYFFVYESYILGSVVGTPSSKVGKTSSGKTKNFPSGTIYYTLNNKAYKSEPNLNGEFEETALRISETNKRKKLKEASVCFYGQKAGNFLSVFKAGFIKKLKLLAKEAEDKKKSIPFRLYNFGGNPMMVKLAEGHVDAVIELKGQKLYDVIPGAFIAQKAGAFWGDLSGKIIDDDYLKQHGFLSNPNKKLSYILASSKRLYNEILNCL
jgi:fructose-1,6-bisphosphatase/inositol monophosphatase family enzyme